MTLPMATETFNAFAGKAVRVDDNPWIQDASGGCANGKA
jgi:hypothetical protein